MLDKIVPGACVNIKIVKQPTSVAAAKTLVRILSKDPDIRAENTRLRRIRKTHYNPGMRGGRYYAGRLVKQRPVRGRAGEAGMVRATCDVLRDLRGVERFIEVQPA